MAAAYHGSLGDLDVTCGHAAGQAQDLIMIDRVFISAHHFII